MQALLPCVAKLSKLPLHDVWLKVQQFPADSAFQAAFQHLPQTLRQLLVTSEPSADIWAAVLNAEPLPPASPPARLQTTALRHVLLHDKLISAL